MNFFFIFLLILSTFISLVEGVTLQLVAGNLAPDATSGENVPGTLSSLNDTRGIWMDSKGNLQIAEAGNFRIRTLDSNGIIRTTIGSGQQSNDGVNATSTTVKFDGVYSVVGDTAGNLYISSGNYFIWKYAAGTGAVTRIAGATPASRGYGGDSGPANLAILNRPMGMSLTQDGSLLVADYGNNRVRKINLQTNVITNFAGNGVAGYSGDGGPATSASLSGPTSVFAFAIFVYITDSNNNAIRAVESMGNNIIPFRSNLNHPTNFAMSSTGTLTYFTQGCNIMDNGIQVPIPLIGSSSCGVERDDEFTKPQDPISEPRGITFNKMNQVYFAEKNIIRKVLFQDPPSRQPTMSPTTASPTFSPSTLSPTFSPSTLAPTFSPSTLAPTFSPSTLTPTLSPTLTSNPSSSSPSFKPSSSEGNTTISSSSSSSERLSDINIFYATFFPALLVLIVLAVFLCCYCSKISAGSEKDKNQNSYEKVEKGVETAGTEKSVVERQRYYELWIH